MKGPDTKFKEEKFLQVLWHNSFLYGMSAFTDD